jgi:hypothetical protein
VKVIEQLLLGSSAASERWRDLRGEMNFLFVLRFKLRGKMERENDGEGREGS